MTDLSEAPASATDRPDSPVVRTFSRTSVGGDAARTGRTSSRSSWLPGYLRRALQLDVLAALFAAAAAVAVVRVSAGAGAVGPGGALAAVSLAPLAWLLAMAQARGYERRLLGVGAEELRAVPRATVRLLAAVAVLTLTVGGVRTDLVRTFLLVFVPVVLLVSLGLRYWLRQRLHRRRHRGFAMQRAVVVGAGEAVDDLVQDLRRDASHGLRPVAACTTVAGPTIDGVRRGTLEDAVRVVDELSADVVVVAHPSGLTPTRLRRLSWALEEREVELMVSPGIMEVAGPRLSIRPSSTLSLVHVERPTVQGGALAGKVVFDRIAALLLLILLAPLLLVLSLAVALDSRGPVLFRQVRVGAGGRPFRMLKLRSMVADAEQRLADVRSEADHGNGRLYKRHDDPRVTRVGRLLRRYSLDELPQLVNVLRGDMSLVGPRPPLQDEVAGYEADAIRRLRVRPGLTGLWQVSGRSDLSWDESLRLDLRYVDNWSMMLDLQILWRTARAVLRGEGAY
ncbi:exopolysaccharide biosynthesis polyprenyl glycosylphosphotransferase [Luteipulveratus sp. YIM 133132]|uniref:exopolysaccharide biosynthesis polyprenyl glycosylphosphotransferase n=1 Tax=Luteipulveratus flavus TaxID=3031728 RepID=UPI0023B120DE|nr:exopolysaccharide biosynthesis polyprenyl glycosylphosphotransferase [Luteipulveratus sp. YIM 133132]MDE9364317.1 exopolysaccharide biosynthesis polyprenyl glycosylphosphotransferase [Luteipulveratus sp. YIM 133132]